MKNTLKFALTAVLFAAAPLASAEALDCVKVSSAVKSAVSANSDKVLEIVATQIAANESCACEIVKAAIISSEADKNVVAQIVDTAILEVPSELRVIAQCAIAVAPDAVTHIQAVVEKYDKSAGAGYSEKGGLDDSKGAVPEDQAASPNPLDFPGVDPSDPIGPRPGAPGSFTLLPLVLPPVLPPIVTPPTASEL